nr:hypothetical protein GTC16762_33550 [Pigmentibacter ruber]
MIDILLDNDGEIDIKNGKILSTENIAQAIKIRLRTFKGEYFLDETRGVPYYQKILGKKTTKQNIDLLFKKEIMSIKNVEKIIKFNSYTNNKTYYYNADIKTKNSDVFTIKDNI